MHDDDVAPPMVTEALILAALMFVGASWMLVSDRLFYRLKHHNKIKKL